MCWVAGHDDRCWDPKILGNLRRNGYELEPSMSYIKTCLKTKSCYLCIIASNERCTQVCLYVYKLTIVFLLQNSVSGKNTHLFCREQKIESFFLSLVSMLLFV